MDRFYTIEACPYCGSTAMVIAPSGDDDNGPFCVQCEQCYANGPQLHKDLDGAIRKWNEVSVAAQTQGGK